MNKQRRAKLDKLHTRLDEIWIELTDIRDEEQDAYEALPESLQGGERGCAMLEAVDALDDALSATEDARDHLTGLL